MNAKSLKEIAAISAGKLRKSYCCASLRGKFDVVLKGRSCRNSAKSLWRA
jgi:hypothetical protein